MKTICVSAAATVCSLGAHAAILNGSFEFAELDTPTRIAINQLEDWDASGGFTLLERGVNSISNIAAHSGEQFVSLGHSGTSGDTLGQTFATITGEQYDVSFFINIIQGIGLNTLVATVYDADSSDELGSVTASASVRTDEWIEHGFSFVAAGDSTRLEFVLTTSGGSSNLVLDTVTVTIPGPGGLVVGLAGVGAIARRRRADGNFPATTVR